jgi:hypothetical protein
MYHRSKIILFKDTSIRSYWDTDLEEWFFFVVALADVVAVISDSANPTDYLKRIRKRDEQLGKYVGTNCPQVALQSATDKLRKTVATFSPKKRIAESNNLKNFTANFFQKTAAFVEKFKGVLGNV